MPETSSNTKRIAKNTIALYVRMLFSVLIGLYTSRVVLQVLGVEDYGVYNVVSGIVGILAFLNSTLSSATSRFITFALGKNDKTIVNETFSAAFLLHLFIAILVVILVETLGVWFLFHKLVIPEGRMKAAFWVLQFSTVSSFFNITQVPYNASIIAHERINIFAYIQIIESILKLLVVFILPTIVFDRLILYAFLYLVVSIIIMSFYRFYATHSFEECHVRFSSINRETLFPMLSFTGWDVLGHFGYTFRYQGCNMVLNIFFGALVNAAAGIASTVQGILLQFSNNITVAVKPQLIKKYSVGDIESMIRLLNSSIRLNLFLILLITIPTAIEIPFLLSLWLVEVPDYCVPFCQFALLANVFSSYSQLVYTGIQASGDLKRTSINRSAIYIASPFIVYALFYCNSHLSPVWTYFVLLLGQFIQGVLDIIVLKHTIPSLPTKVLTIDIIKIFIICVSVSLICFYIKTFISNSISCLFIVYVVAGTLLLFLFYFYVFKNDEKERIKAIIMRRSL